MFSRSTPGEIRKLQHARDVEGLLTMLRTPEVSASPKRRRQIMFALNKVGDSAAAPELRRFATTDDDEMVRLGAVHALSALGDRGSLSVFARALGERRAGTRIHAVEGLGRTGLPDAVPWLMATLRDPDATVRVVAARTLADLGDPAALPPLRQAVGATWRPLLKPSLWSALRELEQRNSR